MASSVKRLIDRLVYGVIILLVGIMTCVTFIQVIARYVFHSPTSWSEEVARYLFVWLVFLAASLGFRQGAHLGVDFFVGLFPPRVRRVVGILVSLFLCFLLIVVIWQGAIMTQMVNRQLSPALRIPMSWVYAAIPVGGFLMLIEVIARFVSPESRGTL